MLGIPFRLSKGALANIVSQCDASALTTTTARGPMSFACNDLPRSLRCLQFLESLCDSGLATSMARMEPKEKPSNT